MSNRAITPHCAWAIGAGRARQLPPMLRWLIVTIAERVDRNTLQWWSSVAAMMSDTGLSRRQVQYLIRKLPADLIAVRRGANGRWMFTLLRPAVDPEAHAPERGAQCAPPDPERGAQPAPYPLKEESPEEKEERVPPASPPAPAPSPSGDFLVDEGQASGIEAVPAVDAEPPPASPSARRTPLPDDWTPPPEVRRMALEAGYDPAEIVEEMADWAREDPTHRQSADWAATMRRWIKRERKYAGRPRSAGERADQSARSVLADVAAGLASMREARA